jgi:hypothetical protein
MNNQITIEQWNELMEAVDNHTISANQPSDVLYRNSVTNSSGKQRFFCYDNYDRIDSPGLDLNIEKDSRTGTLTVYNGSEQARAPITFEQGLQIASNFFNEYGGQMAEEIVCEWVMDGNKSVF